MSVSMLSKLFNYSLDFNFNNKDFPLLHWSLTVCNSVCSSKLVCTNHVCISIPVCNGHVLTSKPVCTIRIYPSKSVCASDNLFK